ncbi:hypothetical protein HID58_066330, partial [Brassica napus]
SSSYAVSRSLLSGVFPTASKPICSSSTSLGLITSSLDLHEYYSSSPHMGSSYRSKSTHMADIKGKGILYEDDDEPIKLTDHDVSQNINEFKLYATERNNNGRRNYDLDHPLEAYKGRVDRMIRRRDDQSWRKRYGGARVEAKPYDRYNGASWREKKSQPQSHHDENVVHDRLVRASMDRGDGSYDHQMRSVSPLPRESAKRVQADREASPQQSQPRPSPDQRSLGVATVTRRIASAIVTPSRGDSLDENVTKRLKGTPWSLAFETLTEQDPKPTTEDDQMVHGLMDCEMENDDLMGLELAEMEDKNGHDRADHVADQKSHKLAGRSSRHIKHGYKSSASLGIQKKKFEILLRGSPQKRSSSSLAA